MKALLEANAKQRSAREVLEQRDEQGESPKDPLRPIVRGRLPHMMYICPMYAILPYMPYASMSYICPFRNPSLKVGCECGSPNVPSSLMKPCEKSCEAPDVHGSLNRGTSIPIQDCWYKGEPPKL